MKLFTHGCTSRNHRVLYMDAEPRDRAVQEYRRSKYWKQEVVLEEDGQERVPAQEETQTVQGNHAKERLVEMALLIMIITIITVVIIIIIMILKLKNEIDRQDMFHR